ncbi:hypothetical protein [Spirosoma foliorum]|uniref:Uncharacterized protein n=1 Tax=Spirosoma foliorum TaxID=2710596 RepID=A0A7G5H5D5_9BACT|nr:hypothetical protein [Spirosoma foliorum]QMW06327.1 hypothetical protein H3H32_16275 [Spirosoma foliorum]
MSQPAIPKIIRTCAHWLTAELFDEFSLSEPAQMEPHFRGWLLGFYLVNKQLHQNVRPTTMIRLVSQEAERYYYTHLHQKHHLLEDKAWFCFMLSKAMLMVAGHYPKKPVTNSPRPASDNPVDFLTVESLHAGHYVALTGAIRAMTWSTGQKDRGYCDQDDFVSLSLPLILN